MWRKPFSEKLWARCFLLGLCTCGLWQPAAGLVEAQSKPGGAMAAESSNQFTLDLHRKLSQEPGNLFYSPASISVALGMTYAGAEAETRSAMGQVLHVPPEPSDWLKSTQELLPLFNQKLDGFQVNLANRLWGQEDFNFNPSYLEMTENVWQAPLGRVDFVQQSEPARLKINQWVEAKTNQRIKDLLPAGSVTGDTRLVLTNAIYFKADWASQFKKAATAEAPFSINASETVKIPLMTQKGNFGYFEDEKTQFLSLPYKAGDIVMELILPKTIDGLAQAEADLNLEQLQRWREQLTRREVEVFLPKFKMNSAFSLKKVLSEMGMERAFSSAAEFGGMTTETELAISEVFHKAFVEVDETGTEAAAATGVVVVTRAARPQSPAVFRADHPFLMILRHQPTGLILFVGRVANPS